MYFLNDLYPLISKRHENVRFVIAGRHPREELKRACFGNERVELIDSPEDMDAVIRKANVYLCPTRLGGGLKLRIMDGLKMGIPVLAHEISARGYEKFAAAGILTPFSTNEEFVEGFDRIVDGVISRNVVGEEIVAVYDEVFSFS